MESHLSSDAELVRRLAVEHLPEADLEPWLALLRPAIQLVPLPAEALPIARLGGSPSLPERADWPEWPDHGPLSYIGELMCDRLATFPLDIRLPSRGRLLFFYFDGSYDNGISTVGTWDASTLQGARVVYVSDAASCSPRPSPAGIMVYPERQYQGRAIVTAPGWEHPDLDAAFRRPNQDDRSFLDHPVNADAFVRWDLLLQVDTDGDLGMEWGDGGVLYWMTRTHDHGEDPVTLGDVSFTWQCS